MTEFDRWVEDDFTTQVSPAFTKQIVFRAVPAVLPVLRLDYLGVEQGKNFAQVTFHVTSLWESLLHPLKDTPFNHQKPCAGEVYLRGTVKLVQFNESSVLPSVLG